MLQAMRLINELYHVYNRHQFPTVILLVDVANGMLLNSLTPLLFSNLFTGLKLMNVFNIKCTISPSNCMTWSLSKLRVILDLHLLSLLLVHQLVWSQFATEVFRGGIGRLTCIGSCVNKQVTTFTFRAQATACSKHHTRTVIDAGCKCAPWVRSANLSDSWALVTVRSTFFLRLSRFLVNGVAWAKCCVRRRWRGPERDARQASDSAAEWEVFVSNAQIFTHQRLWVSSRRLPVCRYAAGFYI